MFPAFLAQFAAGCFLAVAVCAIRTSGWRYLRMMAILSGALALLAVVFLVREGNLTVANLRLPALIGVAVGCLCTFAWLFVNAAQGEAVGVAQRIWPAAAGIACLLSAVVLVFDADAPTARRLALAAGTGLGAALLGTATAAMLLGHRYLIDFQMPIAPLRRLTMIYLGVLVLRIGWVAVTSLPLWSAGFHPAGSALYFWLAVCVRVGVGLVVTAIFGWMAWDCVRRRATQSATALFYLSMIMVFIGELSSQFLMRTEQLAM